MTDERRYVVLVRDHARGANFWRALAPTPLAKVQIGATAYAVGYRLRPDDTVIFEVEGEASKAFYREVEKDEDRIRKDDLDRQLREAALEAKRAALRKEYEKLLEAVFTERLAGNGAAALKILDDAARLRKELEALRGVA